MILDKRLNFICHYAAGITLSKKVVEFLVAPSCAHIDIWYKKHC